MLGGCRVTFFSPPATSPPDPTDVKRSKPNPSVATPPSCVPKCTTKANGLVVDRSSSHNVNTDGDEEQKVNDDGLDLLHPAVRPYLSVGGASPKSLLLNYAGQLFILQPSLASSPDDEDESVRKSRLRGSRAQIRVRISHPCH